MSDAGVRAPNIKPTAAESTFVWFQRVMAGYCLLFGVLYWVRLVGIYPGSLWRFDLMPVYWQVAATALAALFPFAAIGLWMLTSWGPVIWLFCAAAETVMYAGFPDLFGTRSTIVFAHGFAALLYVAFRLTIRFQHRQRSQ